MNGLEHSLLSNKLISEASASAVKIAEMVISELKSKKLDISKMVGLGNDRANDTTDQKGVVVKLL